MSQSALLAGLLAFAFVLFVAANGRLPKYTGVLWGATDQGGNGGPGGDAGGGKTGGNVLDRNGDGFDAGDAARLGSMVVPFPFNIPFELYAG